MSARDAIQASGGWAESVSDVDLVAGIRLLAETTGIFAETAGGVTVAVARALAASGRLRPDDEVVLCNTGHGLKTVEVLGDGATSDVVIAPRLREVAALVADLTGPS